MLIPGYQKKFKKDIKKLKKQGKKIEKLKTIMHSLIHEQPLDKKYLNHPLEGEYKDCMECHIEPDWLLIYMIKKDIILFIRTGSHSELFK